MKILQIIPYFEWSYGGPVRVLYELTRELIKRGHDVTIYTTDVGRRNPLTDKQKIRIDSNPKVHYFKCQNNWIADRLKLHVSFQMRSAIKKSLTNFDVVHLHDQRGIPNLLVWYYAKKNIPYVLQAHGALPKTIPGQNLGVVCLKIMFDTIFGNSIVRDASKVIALTNTEAEQYREMGVPEEKIVIISNGIDLSEYTVLPSRGSFKRKFGIKDEERIVLYLGRLHKIKGIDTLVKAFTNVINNLDDVSLVVVGPDDGSLNELQTLVKDLGVEKKVFFIGPLYGLEKIEAYVDSEVYVLPSIYETFGMTVLEAYACGKPVIASNVAGLRDLVINGETGLLFEPENKEQLTKNILHLLNDNCLAEEMGLKGRQLVKEKFTINKVVAKLEKVYLKLPRVKARARPVV